jgi:hypothetical protein
VPDLGDTDQYKYYPWFRVVKDKGSSSGFGLSYTDYVFAYSYTDLGVRLACKDEELAQFRGETFTDLYTDLLS